MSVLGLCMRRFLEVESTKHSEYRTALVVLQEPCRGYILIKLPLGEGFKKISARVGKDPRLKDEHTLYICFYVFHIKIIVLRPI